MRKKPQSEMTKKALINPKISLEQSMSIFKIQIITTLPMLIKTDKTMFKLIPIGSSSNFRPPETTVACQRLKEPKT